MEKKTKGAWLVHHADKLAKVHGTASFESIELAGKCGRLLSSLSASNQTELTKAQVEALSRHLGINTKMELPSLLQRLRDKKLIDQSKEGGTAVLALTSANVLEHTAGIFETSEKTAEEDAALHAAEACSQQPMKSTELQTVVADEAKLSAKQYGDFIASAESIGFLDVSGDAADKVYFNGHIFRRDPQKIKRVLDALSPVEAAAYKEFDQRLSVAGCVAWSSAETAIGAALLGRLVVVGIYDVSAVSNEVEEAKYITRPSAFGKFGSALEADALDLAKALVASLTYGMHRRDRGLGRIQMLGRLLAKLNEGAWVGPATAIGEDYKILEMRRVVEVRPAGGGRYHMRLLKKDVGLIAQHVLQQGDASDAALVELPGAALTAYAGPEANREHARKKQQSTSASKTNDILRAIRTKNF